MQTNLCCIVLLLAGSFTYCAKSENTNSTSTSSTTTTTNTTATAADVSFNNYIKSSILVKCVSCHGSRGGVSYTGTYSDLLSKKTAFNTVIQNGSMPEGNPLSSADRALVQAWINRGAPEN